MKIIFIVALIGSLFIACGHKTDLVYKTDNNKTK